MSSNGEIGNSYRTNCRSIKSPPLLLLLFSAIEIRCDSFINSMDSYCLFRGFQGKSEQFCPVSGIPIEYKSSNNGECGVPVGNSVGNILSIKMIANSATMRNIMKINGAGWILLSSIGIFIFISILGGI